MIKGQSIRCTANLVIEAKGEKGVMFVVKLDSIIPTRQKEIGIHYLQKDWHGREPAGIQHRTMDVYPIDFVSLPSERWSLKNIGEVAYVATRQVDLSIDPASVVHLANLLLECFGEFKIFDTSKHEMSDVPTRQFQWEVLPKGSCPRSKVSRIVAPFLAKLSPSEKGLIDHGVREIYKYESGFLAIGRGGYSGCFVYVFTPKELQFWKVCISIMLLTFLGVIGRGFQRYKRENHKW